MEQRVKETKPWSKKTWISERQQIRDKGRTGGGILKKQLKPHLGDHLTEENEREKEEEGKIKFKWRDVLTKP